MFVTPVSTMFRQSYGIRTTAARWARSAGLMTGRGGSGSGGNGNGAGCDRILGLGGERKAEEPNSGWFGQARNFSSAEHLKIIRAMRLDFPSHVPPRVAATAGQTTRPFSAAAYGDDDRRAERERRRENRRQRTKVLDREDGHTRTGAVAPRERQRQGEVFGQGGGRAAASRPGSEAGGAPVSQYDALSTGQAAYMRKVYGVTGSMCGVASVGMFAGVLFPISPLITGLGSLGVLLALSFGTNPQTTPAPVRFGLLAAFAGLSGMSAGPLIGMSLQMDPLILPMAALASTGIFAGASIVSLLAPEGKMLSWGGPLMGGCFAMIGLGLVGMFYPHPIFQSIHLYGGLALFTAFVAYDTQQMVEDYRNGLEDPISHATGLFINIMAIFKRMLFIFMNRDD